MALPANVWDQLKSITAGELAKALTRDGWAVDADGGSQRIFWKNGRRVSVHIHPQKTYGPGLLKQLLADTGWTVDDYRRLKLIK